jgi:hypothetical protein
MEGWTMNELIGTTILRLWVDDEQHLLIFETDRGDMAYETYGDCCSETWFADIIGVKDLIGQRILAVEAIEMDSVEDERTRQEQDEFYSVKLTTLRGYVDIIFRNSSNGYYGGNINHVNYAKRPDHLSEITTDWQAP